nr:hypothetical protein [Tanacetum cinerariifolium]
MDRSLSNQSKGGRILFWLVRQDHLHQDKEEHQANKGSLRVTTAKAKVTCPSNAQNPGGSAMPNAKIALMANLSHYGSDNLAEITILKDDLQKEESKNIDRELALEKEALGFQNPRYLKKAQQLKPTLYDGSVVGKSDVIVVPDSKNTLMHAEENGTWGFEQTKACFRDDIIPFVKNLKELFTSFDQCLIDEVIEVQNIFKQMELAVEQHCAEKTNFQTKMENVLKENDRLLTHALSVEIMNI